MKFENQIIGFVIYEDGTFDFANPCRIPLKFLEDIIKQYKEKKLTAKKGEVCIVTYLQFKLPKALRKRIKEKNGNN